MLETYRRMLCLLLLIVVAHTQGQPLIWPQPSQFTYNSSSEPLALSPCNVRYIIESPIAPIVEEMINLYLKNAFNCQDRTPGINSLNVVVKSSNMTLPTETLPQSYSLVARLNGRWDLIADYYVGFLRGFETYCQLFSPNEEGAYWVNGLPLTVDDKPEFKWRGLMIDSSRHFLPLPIIKKTIDGLMYNKMNILHWHIIDQDSFPMQIPTIPELNEYGSIGGSYSPAELKQVIDYAKNRGVRVVVEIDTPAHTHSWGRSDKYKDIVVRCNNVFTGQFDPTLDGTYDVVKQVMQFVDTTFSDPYIHFGGDQTSGPCWDLKPSIKEWMTAQNMTVYKDLETYYRRRQKSIWRTISPSKKAIYWANEAIDLPLESDDVLQWWGISTNLNRIVGRPNQVILSSYDLLYLDKGFGNRNGISYGDFIKWRDVYAFNPRLDKVNVIGGQACMWSQISNLHVHDQKIWGRTMVLAERLWNDGIDIKTHLQSIARRLLAQTERMKARGFKMWPVTVGICEQDMEICFS